MATLAQTIAAEAVKVVEKVASRPTNDLSQPAIEHAGPELQREIGKEVASVVQHATNQEPWYQSRVTLGALLAGAAGIAAVFGYAFPQEMQGKVIEAVIAAGPIVGALIALYGRWVATKPLGA